MSQVTDLPALGLRLRAARKRAGLTQTDAARRMGFSRYSTISDHERGLREVSEEVLAKYAMLYGVGVATLRYGVSAVAENAPSDPYALSDRDVARVPGLGAVLQRMPPHVYEVAFPLLQMLEATGASREAQDRAEVLFTQLSAGVLTPDLPPHNESMQIADAKAALAMFLDLYARRGIHRHGPLPPLIEIGTTEDPDAVSGAEFEQSLRSGKRKPKAG